MFLRRCQLTLLLAWSATPVSLATAVPFAQLDHAAPVCQGALTLPVAAEYFVEIANPLPEVGDYNALIRKFQAKDWAALATGIETFERAFESSPLREAVAYLKVQMLWEQVEKAETPAAARAEKALREVLLLYPRSTLAPVATASLANFWLGQGKYSKSLALYTQAKESYAFHDLKCVFLAGIAESQFQLADFGAFDGAKTQFQQKCANPRLKLGLQLRAAQLLAAEKPAESAKQLAILEERDAPLLTRYFPTFQFQLGEHYYGRRQYPSARHYFTQFAKLEETEVNCKAHAMKRLGDIALQEKKDTETIVGQYLTAYETAKDLDAGRYAYVRAMLLEYAQKGPGEKDRRLRLVDDQLEKIASPELKELGFLEKGLVLLGEGKLESLDYLERFGVKTHSDLGRGPTGAFVRQSLVGLLAETEKTGDLAALERLEKANSDWLNGQKESKAATILFNRNYLKLALADLAKLDEASFLSRLERISFLSPEQQKQLSQAMILSLVGQSPEVANRLSLAFLKQRSTIDRFKEVPSLVWVLVAGLTGDDKQVAQLLKGRGKGPLAVVDTLAKLPPSLKAPASLAVSSMAIKAGVYDVAELCLDLIPRDTETASREALRFSMAQKRKHYPKAAEHALELTRLSKESADQILWLGKALQVAQQGKLYRSADALLKAAISVKPDDKLRAQLLYFSGRSAYERKDLKVAISDIEQALKLDASATESAEGRYLLGKSLWGKQDKESAKRIWRELASLNDPFWSPLVKNELRLLANP